jgi:predicted nucleic acid-binding protein
MVESTVEDLKRVFEGLNVYSTNDLSETAVDIALNQNIPVYDALYIAATQKANGTLYTADQKLNQTSNTLITTKLLKIKSDN